jgi:hypothetical protein
MQVLNPAVAFAASSKQDAKPKKLSSLCSLARISPVET